MANNRFRGRKIKAAREGLSSLGAYFGWVSVFTRSSVRLFLIAVTVCGIGYGISYAVQRSPHFTIRHVKIETIPQLSQDDILSSLGLNKPVNIFRFDPDKARQKLMEHPWVARAEVSEHLPDRIDIRVTERRPAGVVSLGEFYLVDGEGTPFVRATLQQVDDFPVVTGLKQEEFVRDPARFRTRVQNALSVVRQYSRRGESADFPPVGEVFIDSANRISLMAGRTRIGLGSDGFDEKIARLERVFKTMKVRKVGADYILFGDVPSRVVVKERLIKRKKTKTITLNVSGA